MTKRFRARITITRESYPHLPGWYLRKMRMNRVHASATLEEINPGWQYLGM